MKYILGLLLLVSTALAQVPGGRDTQQTSSWGTDYFTNYVLNPSAKKNVTSISTSSAAVARSTTSGYKIDGVSSISCDASALNGYCELTLDTIRNPADEGNCEFKGLVKGDGTLYAAQILDGSSNVLATSQVLGNQSLWTPFSLNYVCGSSRKVRITQTVAGTAPVIYLGKLYYGQATNLSSNIPPNSFTAQVSTAGVVSNESGGDWISGNCAVTDTSLFTCTYNSGFFPSGSTCSWAPYAGGDPGTSAYVMTGLTSGTTSVVIRALVAGAKTAVNFGLFCSKVGADYLQNSITANNYDYPWTPYTATITGFGTVSSATYYHMRAGDSLFVKGVFTSGTSSAVAALIVLPSGLTVDSTKNSVNNMLGKWNTNSTAKAGFLFAGPTDTALKMSIDTGFNTDLGNAIAASSGIVLFESGPIPITGWSTTQNAPQLLGSVTSNANNALKDEYATITPTSAGTCTASNTSSSWVTTTPNAAGDCTLTFNFSATPNCQFTSGMTSGGLTTIMASVRVSSLSSTSARFLHSYADDSAGTISGIVNASNEAVYVRCIGPR